MYILYKAAIFLLLFAALIKMSQAAYHYCIDSSTKVLSVRLDKPETETFMTNIRNRNKYLASQHCSWHLLMRNMAQPRQLILQPRMQPMPERAVGKLHQNQSHCRTMLSVQLKGSTFQASWHGEEKMPKVPLIVPITHRTQVLTIKFNTGQEEPNENCLRQEVTVEPVVKGYCGRSMLLLGTSCYLISHRTNIMEIHNSQLGSVLKLAAFSSIDNIRQLIHNNNRRIDQYPYLRPLNLRNPVRIGVFRRVGSQQAFYFASKNGSCFEAPFKELEVKMKALKSDASPLSPQCASMQVGATGDVELKFSDCSQQMRMLLSFPETPRTEVEDHCEMPSWSFSVKVVSQFYINDNTDAPNVSSYDNNIPLSIKLSITFILFIFFILVLLLACQKADKRTIKGSDKRFLLNT